MKLKNTFVPVSRLKQDNQVYKDQEGAMYLVDSEHEALAGKEFSNVQEAIQAIQDYNQNSKTPFEGELILLNVIEVS